jgi:small subunit ribosomal protein S1
MKQLEPTTVDHYISEHQAGQTVSGRLVEVSGDSAKVELGEGVMAVCQMKKGMETTTQSAAAAPADVSSLGAMLSARWKKGAPTGEGKETARAGEVRSFRIARLDSAKRLIELELAS